MKIYVKEIEEYLEYVKNNPNEINEDRKLLIENIIIPTLKRDDVFFDSDMFYKCISFCERWYYELFSYQKFIYAFVFMYEKKNIDIPIFRTFFIMMGRGNGKDGAFAPLMHFLTSSAYGIKGYNIDIVATSEEQSNDTFKVPYDMLEENKKKLRKHFYWNKEEIICLKTKSRLKYNTSNAKTKDGKKNGAILYNEFHAYENDKQIKVFQSGLGKVAHPRIFIITTQGDVRGGPLDELLDVCALVLKGESNELRYFPFICRLDNKKEVDNPNTWIKANPSLYYMPILKDNMMLDYLEMQKYPSKKPEFMTKRMNMPEQKQDELITSWENLMKASFKDIENKIERDIPDLKNKNAIIGIDMADLNDFVSVGGLFKENNEFIWRQKTFICSNGRFFKDIKFPFASKGNYGFRDFEIVNTPTINPELVIDWVLDFMSEHEVKKIIMDTYRYKMLKKLFEENGIKEETRTDPYGLVRMIRYPASIAAIFAPKIETEFLEGNVNIGNSAIMRWSVNNTCVKTKKDGNKVYEKIEPKLRKNDPFMAFVCAISGHELLDEQIIYV